MVASCWLKSRNSGVGVARFISPRGSPVVGWRWRSSPKAGLGCCANPGIQWQWGFYGWRGSPCSACCWLEDVGSGIATPCGGPSVRPNVLWPDGWQAGTESAKEPNGSRLLCPSAPWHRRIAWAWSILNAKELEAVIGVRIARGRTGNKHGDRPGHIVLTQPVSGKIAPIIRVTGEFDRMRTVGEGEALTDCRIVAQGDNPDHRTKPRDHSVPSWMAGGFRGLHGQACGFSQS